MYCDYSIQTRSVCLFFFFFLFRLWTFLILVLCGNNKKMFSKVDRTTKLIPKSFAWRTHESNQVWWNCTATIHSCRGANWPMIYLLIVSLKYQRAHSMLVNEHHLCRCLYCIFFAEGKEYGQEPFPTFNGCFIFSLGSWCKKKCKNFSLEMGCIWVIHLIFYKKNLNSF